jgi:hypothetical protein
VVEAANIARVVVTVRDLGSAEYEMLSSGSLWLSSQQKLLEANRRQNSIRRMSGFGMKLPLIERMDD